MTQQEFTAFYPQFDGFALAVVMAAYIGQANERFSAFAPVDAEEARRLYTAHKLTMYARSAGVAKQRIASKKVGEVSVTYMSGTSSSFSVPGDLADLPETDYGLQLLSLIRLYARPVYIP